jgi:glutathione S-transferase
MRLGATEIDHRKRDGITRGFVCVEQLLTDNVYVAGDRLTLADFPIWSLLETITKFMGVTAEQYPKIFGYMEKLREELPFKDLMAKNVAEHYQMLQNCIEKNKAAQN